MLLLRLVKLPVRSGTLLRRAVRGWRKRAYSLGGFRVTMEVKFCARRDITPIAATPHDCDRAEQPWQFWL